MKKFYVLSLLALLFISCSDDDGFISTTSHQFQVDLGEDMNHIPAQETNISLENVEDGKTYSVTTDMSGNATIELAPGIYNINFSRSFTAEEYLEISGIEATGEVVYNGSLESVSISDANTSTEISLVTGQIGDLLFKQIYFAGSDVRQGAMYRDQFVEIHNNSPVVHL